MQTPEAFDLAGNTEAAGEQAGCSHHTVAGRVAKRGAAPLAGGGGIGAPGSGRSIRGLGEGGGAADRSKAEIRAAVAYSNLRRLGFTGSERPVARAVAWATESYRAGPRRVYRPRIPESGTAIPPR